MKPNLGLLLWLVPLFPGIRGQSSTLPPEETSNVVLPSAQLGPPSIHELPTEAEVIQDDSDDSPPLPDASCQTGADGLARCSGSPPMAPSQEALDFQSYKLSRIYREKEQVPFQVDDPPRAATPSTFEEPFVDHSPAQHTAPVPLPTPSSRSGGTTLVNGVRIDPGSLGPEDAPIVRLVFPPEESEEPVDGDAKEARVKNATYVWEACLVPFREASDDHLEPEDGENLEDYSSDWDGELVVEVMVEFNFQGMVANDAFVYYVRGGWEAIPLGLEVESAIPLGIVQQNMISEFGAVPAVDYGSRNDSYQGNGGPGLVKLTIEVERLLGGAGHPVLISVYRTSTTYDSAEGPDFMKVAHIPLPGYEFDSELEAPTLAGSVIRCESEEGRKWMTMEAKEGSEKRIDVKFDAETLMGAWEQSSYSGWW